MEDELQPRLSQRLHISKPEDTTDNSLFLKPIPGYVVAVMEPIERQAEFTAMFAAAFELFDALEVLHDACSCWQDQDDPALRKARNAIALAKRSDLCVECKQPTNFGSGRFVNRTETGNGWLCPDCLHPETCFFCEKNQPIENEIYCDDCSEEQNK